MENVTDLNSRRGRRESVSDAYIDATIGQMRADDEERWPSGEAVYQKVGCARTRCFARLKELQRQDEAQRLKNPGQLPTPTLDALHDGLQLVMLRLEQDVQARLAHRETEWELEKIALHEKIAEAKKAELAETYRADDLQKQLAAVEHQLVASQTDNRLLRERNEALHRYNEQHKAEARAAQQIADDRGNELAASRATRQQLENALEASRVSVASLQSENRDLQNEQARLQMRLHDLTTEAQAQHQVHERETASWRQQAQHYDETIADLESRAHQAEEDRQALQQQLQHLQAHVDALTQSLAARPAMTPESIQALLREELKAVATGQSTAIFAITDESPAWRRSCAAAMRAILDKAEVTPGDLGRNGSSAQRILAHEGTEQDIVALFEPGPGQSEGKMPEVLKVCPDVATFMY